MFQQFCVYGLMAASTAWSPDFGAPAFYDAGVAAGPTVKGDFNGDGRTDLLLTASGSLRALLGNGDGSFNAAIASSARELPYGDLAVADFNRDGRLDVVGVSYDFAAIQYGAGDGTFGEPQALQPPRPAPPFFPDFELNHVAAGDVNGDGAVDIVAVDTLAVDELSGMWYSEITTFLNRGDGSFAVLAGPATPFWSAGGNTSVQLVNYDGDGDLDVVLANVSYGAILYDGLGDGQFKINFAWGYSEYGYLGMFLSDFNADGVVDLAVGPVWSDPAIWFQVGVGAGDGSFSPNELIYQGNFERNPVGADFNRDGLTDFAVSSDWYPGFNAVHLGNGALGVAPGIVFSTDASASTRALIVDDLNADGYPDLIAMIGSNVCVLLNDRQWPVWASISNCIVTEGNRGTTNADFTVSLHGNYSTPVTIDFAAQSYTATAGEDFVPVSGTLTFAPGEKTKSISVQVIGDRNAEYEVIQGVTGDKQERFRVRLANALGNATDGWGTIVEDEPTISIGSVSGNEGGKRIPTVFQFEISLSHAYDAPVTATYTTENGSAVAGSDYVAKSGTVEFLPGQTKKIVTVNVIGDNRREPDEYFLLRATSCSLNAFLVHRLNGSTGVGTILNDD